jgi:hypothetical protein
MGNVNGRTNLIMKKKIRDTAMKYYLLLIAILTSLPVFAACPIEGEGSACVAEFQETGIPGLISTPSVVAPAMPTSNFSATPATVNSNREYEPKKETRIFGTTEQNYGYNSSCQFGVCMDTGTPKTFPLQPNEP